MTAKSKATVRRDLVKYAALVVLVLALGLAVGALVATKYVSPCVCVFMEKAGRIN